MEKIKIRALEPWEIDIRVQSVSEKGVSLLLYKNARADMNILDELYGVMGWQRQHTLLGESNYCTVSVRDPETGEWISKQDVGVPTFADPLKGAASDAFKRACTNIGIGRELYTAPFIWIPADRVNIIDNAGKRIVKDRFHVSEIAYDDRRNIIQISICNQRNEVVFQFGAPAGQVKNEVIAEEKSKQFINSEQLAALKKLLKKHGISEQSVLQKHGLASLKEMDTDLYSKAMLALVPKNRVA